MKDSFPILVTGSHRSGTTWVGKVLATSASTAYIHEPFNGMCRPGIFSLKFPNVFTYITQENENEFYSDISSMLSFKYNAKAELNSCEQPKDIARLIRDCSKSYKSKLFMLSPLVKDPMAVFSSEWLAEIFGARVIILIRHPASFVSSCHQLGWPFHFENLLNQPLLIRDYLYPFESEIIHYTNNEYSSIDSLSFLWKLIYYVVDKFRQQHPSWLFIRYEDICVDPMVQYKRIFSEVGIDFSTKSQSFIRESTTYSAYKGAFKEIHSVKRNSKENVAVWKQRLTHAEIQRIKHITKPVAQKFYADEAW